MTQFEIDIIFLLSLIWVTQISGMILFGLVSILNRFK